MQELRPEWANPFADPPSMKGATMAAVVGLKPTQLQKVRGRLEAFAAEMFEPMERSDQRRWGEVYLRGLMLEQWILGGKLKTVQTPGGHHRLTEAALRPFLQKDNMKPAVESRQRYRRVSGRNQLVGKVVSIRIEGLLAEVVLSVGDTRVTAIITANAVRELQLKKGDTAAALIKSTDVMIERLDDLT